MPALRTEIAEGVRIAGRALWQQKARALLTTLGIVIGIVSVTSMFTVINGIEKEFDRSMAMIGDDALFVQRTPWIILGLGALLALIGTGALVLALLMR